ncbi:MotA/TolQ/ExbB proton channel family protein [Rheinheimera texasensis]|jgi:biopolymer transport protein ExbB|uniref:MotA/TolQ/ExbB proton channel family protein n=1 Tax=Rheinheimera texasensis TaxID=306205 RepID=UPI0032B187A0
MHSLIELWESVRDFIATGGSVLYIVAFVLFAMWVLIIERFWFVTRDYPVLRDKIVSEWNARTDTTSWYAHKIRDAWVSEASAKLTQRMNVINTLIAVCPMVGLLGTVTGMIAVFEIMALQGTGNPRLMAAGISMATIPTMAGMVACLSGVFVASKLEGKIKSAIHELADSLPHH